MHELSMALSILDIAAEESRQRGGAEIQAIHIRIGVLSGVVEEALISAFDLARESSPFPDCRLKIEQVPVRIFCAGCQENRTVKSIQMICCSECGMPSRDILSGGEMEITAMEITETIEPDSILREED